MNTTLLYLFLFISISSFSKNETIFTLNEINIRSYFNYIGISKIDSFSKNQYPDSVFNTNNGKYTVYKFLYEEKNMILFDFNGDTMDLCDDYNILNKMIVLLKTNKRNKIIDAFFFNYAFLEYPFSGGLYRSKKKIRLKNLLVIKRLKFCNVIMHTY